MATAEERPIRVVVYRNRGRWLAQCLEVDLATSADSLPELKERIRGQIQVQIALDRRRGRRLFSTLKPAPPKYWQLYDDANLVDIVEVAEPLVSRLFRLVRWGRSTVTEVARLRIVEATATAPAPT